MVVLLPAHHRRLRRADLQAGAVAARRRGLPLRPGAHLGRLVEIRVDPKVRAQRLANRGRETGDALHKRVAHRVEWSPPDGVPLSVVANDGTLAQAGERLLAVLRRSDDA